MSNATRKIRRNLARKGSLQIKLNAQTTMQEIIQTLAQHGLGPDGRPVEKPTNFNVGPTYVACQFTHEGQRYHFEGTKEELDAFQASIGYVTPPQDPSSSHTIVLTEVDHERGTITLSQEPNE